MAPLLNHLSRALHVLTGQDKPDSGADMAVAAAMKARLEHLSASVGTKPSVAIPGLFPSVSTTGTVVIPSLTLQESVAFAQACLGRDVRRIVDLRSAKEKAHAAAGPLDGSTKRVVQGRLMASFERQGNKSALDAKHGRTPATDAHVSRVEVRLARDGTALGPDGQSSPGHAQVLQLIRMPTGGAGRPISPQRLFDVSLHLAQARQPGGVTVFQCADGGHAGATFAAASGLLQRFLRGEVDVRRMEEAVVLECLRLAGDRPSLFRLEDLASLKAFTRLMLDAERRGGLPARTVEPPPKPPRAVAGTGRSGPPVPPKPVRNPGAS